MARSFGPKRNRLPGEISAFPFILVEKLRPAVRDPLLWGIAQA